MTQQYGIVAHPVAHSLSPAMHNAAFQALGLDARFEAFDVAPEALEAFVSETVRGAGATGGANPGDTTGATGGSPIRGLAVSLPHKSTIGAHLDGIDDVAQTIGAVNTVYWKDGQLWGTNTDALGFARALEAVMPDLSDKGVVVIGAGGAARAILSVVVPRAESVTVINRTVPNGVGIAKDFGCRYGGKIEDLTTETPHLLINATSVGLEGEDEPLIVPQDFIEPEMLIFDVVYRRQGKTRLIQEAEAVGAKAVTGESMLLYQGMEQFKLWTGQPAPEDVMRGALG